MKMSIHGCLFRDFTGFARMLKDLRCLVAIIVFFIFFCQWAPAEQTAGVRPTFQNAEQTVGYSSPGTTVYPFGGMSRIGALTFNDGPSGPLCMVIDPVAGYAYLGVEGGIGSPGQIFKINLKTFTRVATLNLAYGEANPWCAVIDPAAGYAWFGTKTSPARIVKVALGTGDNPPRRVGAITLENDENEATCGVIDPARGYAWFGMGYYPGRIVKVALGIGDDPPARVGALALDPTESRFSCSVIDPVAGYAWFANENYPAGKIVKVALAEGGEPPRRVGVLTLAEGESRFSCGVY